MMIIYTTSAKFLTYYVRTVSVSVLNDSLIIIIKANLLHVCIRKWIESGLNLDCA